MWRSLAQMRSRAPLILFTLTLAACGVRPVEGTVVGERDDVIPNCSVTLEVGTNGGLQQTRTTDDMGKFSFGSLATAGGCAIRFEKPGYESKKLPCPVDSKPLRVVLRESATH